MELEFSPMDVFELMDLIECIPSQWCQSLKINGYVEKESFVLQNEIQLYLNRQRYYDQ